MPGRKIKRRKKVAPGSVGLAPVDTRITSLAPALSELVQKVETDGGTVLGAYSEPFGTHPVLLVALPVGRVQPTPYQRDPSENHVKRLMTVIEKIGRFLDPIITVRQDDAYWTPNGSHRLKALKKLGVRSVIALLVPEADVAFKILALNTEKAHNLREKSLEAIRMARALAQQREMKESDYAFEFEQAPFLTLGLCYEQRPRISGGAYQPVLKRVDDFLELPMARALTVREKRAGQVLKLDDAVSEVATKLKTRGFTSPYLKPYIVARVNPTRFSKATSFDFDEVLKKMIGSAERFNVEKVKQQDLARIGGAPPAED
jgi:ParB family chromosome partitioning protein